MGLAPPVGANGAECVDVRSCTGEGRLCEASSVPDTESDPPDPIEAKAEAASVVPDGASADLTGPEGTLAGPGHSSTMVFEEDIRRLAVKV
ncbi:hypothetical protein NDU88_002074 [Pleurodeles waltl]|uniref:Uncharacterized protein n=1 Tax=Pleurodeles waltl TaxID=8319 RepID=A0AAV7WQK9_PLEWA|nr:hypothetical protein NDU88_002074 [Pleurodeles waltl]